MALINVENISKNYTVHLPPKGMRYFLADMFAPQTKTVETVKNISFHIEQGEMVGFIEKNGAGKSTTIKMMSGILRLSSGEIRVDGIVPYVERTKNAQNIGVVFGQRGRLQWDLPMNDSFDIYKEIYQIDDATFQKKHNTFCGNA